MKPEQIPSPIAKKVPYEFEMHGTKIQDEYAWLRANGWPEKITDKKVIAYLEEENKYFENYITPLKEKKHEFFEELKRRIKLADQSTYTKKDNFYYYTKTETDKDYTIYCRKKNSTEAEEEILLNVNELAKGKEYTALGAFSISPNHKLMAYSVDFTGGNCKKSPLKIGTLAWFDEHHAIGSDRQTPSANPSNKIDHFVSVDALVHVIDKNKIIAAAVQFGETDILFHLQVHSPVMNLGMLSPRIRSSKLSRSRITKFSSPRTITSGGRGREL